MKKILLVGPFPPPFGGIASHINDIVPELINDNYKIVTLTWSVKNKIINTSNLKKIYVSVKEFFLKNILFILFDFFNSIKYKKDLSLFDFLKVVNISFLINKTISDENIDIVIIYDNNNGLVIPILKKYYEVNQRINWMIFGEFNKNPDYFKSISKYMYNVFSLTDKIFASSKFCANSVDKVLGYNFKVDIIYIGVDNEIYFSEKSKYNFFNTKFSIPKNSIKLLFLGRMVEDMGLNYILDSLDDILKIDEFIYVIIAGADGLLTEKVVEISKSNPRVKVSINIPFNEKSIYYNSSDIVLAPSAHNHACMGVTIKEAMACKKPIIGSNSGGIPAAVIDKYNGYIIPMTKDGIDKKIFLKRIEELVNNSLLRTKMGNNGYKLFLKKFTNMVTVEKYKKLLKDTTTNF